MKKIHFLFFGTSLVALGLFFSQCGKDDPIDGSSPTVTLNGDAVVTVSLGDTYTDDGATASDDIDGDLTGSIIDDAADVNTNLMGTYTVTYEVADAAGNVGTATRTVHVRVQNSDLKTVAQGMDQVATSSHYEVVENCQGGVEYDMLVTPSQSDPQKVKFTNYMGFYVKNQNDAAIIDGILSGDLNQIITIDGTDGNLELKGTGEITKAEKVDDVVHVTMHFSEVYYRNTITDATFTCDDVDVNLVFP